MATKMLRPNVGIYVATANAFADWTAPTLTEITNASNVFNISPAVTDDYTLNMTDSASDNSLAIVDNASVTTPTYYNYEASLDGFRDADASAASVYNKFRDLFAAADVKYYLIKRVGKAHDAAFAAGVGGDPRAPDFRRGVDRRDDVPQGRPVPVRMRLQPTTASASISRVSWASCKIRWSSTCTARPAVCTWV